MANRHITRNSTTLDPAFATVTEEVMRSPSAPTRPQGHRGQVRELDPETLAAQNARAILQNYNAIAHETPSSDATAAYPYVKRALDLTLASLALIAFAPLMILIAVAIRLDSHGPALFIQDRVGQGGRYFRMLKFRTMTNGSGVKLNGLHKHVNDKRITRIGRFLRKTSLDELPQLINVVLGQMSLVGPRPELPEIMLNRYEPWQYQRLTVPQGITGWWQVTGRGRKMLWKHTADDIYYVERASFWFDLKLLLLTVRAVISRDGAF